MFIHIRMRKELETDKRWQFFLLKQVSRRKYNKYSYDTVHLVPIIIVVRTSHVCLIASFPSVLMFFSNFVTILST